MAIHGNVAPGFEAVRESFERCFVELGKTGAAFSALVDGRTVADLWGGDGVDRNSLVHVYSVSKPMAAFRVLVLVDRGAISLNGTVARTWGLGVMVEPDGYGMGGLGGSLGMADPGSGVAEAYVIRRMGTDQRAEAMGAAVRAALT